MAGGAAAAGRLMGRLRWSMLSEIVSRGSGFTAGGGIFGRRSYISSSLPKPTPTTVITQEDSLVKRCLENEIDYELDRSLPPQPSKFDSFAVDGRPGEQWICLRRNYGNKEEIKIEVTLFDKSPPAPQPTKDKLGDDLEPHITFIVNISKGVDGQKLEILCSAWPSSIKIRSVAMLCHDKMPSQTYMGPLFKDLDDKLQATFYCFLEERGVNDRLARFLHTYMKTKEKMEYIQWLGDVKSFL